MGGRGGGGRGGRGGGGRGGERGGGRRRGGGGGGGRRGRKRGRREEGEKEGEEGGGGEDKRLAEQRSERCFEENITAFTSVLSHTRKSPDVCDYNEVYTSTLSSHIKEISLRLKVISATAFKK